MIREGKKRLVRKSTVLYVLERIMHSIILQLIDYLLHF